MQNKRCSIGLILMLAIFSVTLLGLGTRAVAQERLLYGNFNTTSPDASEPTGGVIFDGPSHLYGTTIDGGAYSRGTVFELAEASGIWTETVAHSFGGVTNDGFGPSGSLVLHAGKLYGTTSDGGANMYGTVFELAEVGGVWTETILHNFGVSTDGQYPNGGLAFDTTGNLYGTTGGGGRYQKCGTDQPAGCGTVYQLKPKTGGGWTYAGAIHSFGNVTASLTDGQFPNGVLFYKGHFYGTTEGGGATGEGMVFELTPPTPPATVWREKVLYDFAGYSSSDGANPTAGLTVDASGDLWGTTSQGGVEQNGVIFNQGTVFELTQESGVWSENVIYSFLGTTNTTYPGFYPDGLYPFNLTFDSSTGNFYVTMLEDGVLVAGSTTTTAFGTVFQLAPNGSGGWTGSVLHDFASTPDGGFPSSALTIDSQGNLYGTTQQGGANGWGSVFEVTP